MKSTLAQNLLAKLAEPMLNSNQTSQPTNQMRITSIFQVSLRVRANAKGTAEKYAGNTVLQSSTLGVSLSAFCFEAPGHVKRMLLLSVKKDSVLSCSASIVYRLETQLATRSLRPGKGSKEIHRSGVDRLMLPTCLDPGLGKKKDSTLHFTALSKHEGGLPFQKKRENHGASATDPVVFHWSDVPKTTAAFGQPVKPFTKNAHWICICAKTSQQHLRNRIVERFLCVTSEPAAVLPRRVRSSDLSASCVKLRGFWHLLGKGQHGRHLRTNCLE